MAQRGRALAHVSLGSRRDVRYARNPRRVENRATGHLGNDPRNGHGYHGPSSRPCETPNRERARGSDARARIHGPQARDAARRHSHRSRLRWIVYKCPYRRPARGGQCRSRQARLDARARDGRAWLAAGEGAGGARGVGSRLPRRGLGVAQRRLLDVPRHECRCAGRRGALCGDVEPQFRRPSGTGRPHPSDEPRDGGSGRDRGPPRGRARMVTPFVRHRGKVVALPRANVDTDQIIPKQFLKGVERVGFGSSLFYDWRANPDFELNRPAAQGATILVTGPNFGCGSSREHAVWALAQYGFRAIIAPSFADIFLANCYRNGVLPVQLPGADVDTLIQRAAGGSSEFAVDLEECVVSDDAGFSAHFSPDPYGRELLLHGLDEIGRTLLEEPSIAAYERSHA